MKNFGGHSEGFGKRGAVDRNDHEFLNVDAVVRVGAAVQNIDVRYGKKITLSSGQIGEQLLFRGPGGGRGGRHGDGKNRIGSQPLFRRCAVKGHHPVVQLILPEGVHAGDFRGQNVSRIGDGLADTFAQVPGWISVSEFQGFPFSGGGPGWNRGFPGDSGSQRDFCFDGRVSAGVQDFTRKNMFYS